MIKLIFLLLTIPTVTIMQSINSSATDNEGANLFLRKPNNYTFKCGCDLGEVLEVSLSKDGEMIVKYYYMCGGKKLYGFLEGEYDRAANKFEGIYNTENKFYYGPINFTFNDKGEATGYWDNGVGTVSMLLKSSIE